MFQIPLSDFIGLVWFMAIWIGYTVYTDDGEPRKHSLRAIMHKNRYRWMCQVLKRDNRIMDTNILRQLGQGASFFASTSLLILAGLVGGLGGLAAALLPNELLLQAADLASQGSGLAHPLDVSQARDGLELLRPGQGGVGLLTAARL